MRQRCQNICGLVSRMEEIRSGAVAVFQKRLREKLADLLRGAGIEPQRLAQEAAILADRSDIAEELMRLRTHAAQLESMLAGEGEIGKGKHTTTTARLLPPFRAAYFIRALAVVRRRSALRRMNPPASRWS